MPNALTLRPRFYRAVAVVCLAILAAFSTFSPISIRVSRAQASGNTWTVNDLGDSGTTSCVANAGAGGATCQLRDAINKAQNGDTINFSVTGTITLQSATGYGALSIGTNITISGPGAANLTVSGANAVVVFAANSRTVTGGINGLTIANGNGGGLSNNGTLVVSNCIFSANTGSYGGIFNQNTLTVNSSTFLNNSTNGAYGGAISNDATLVVNDSVFSDNTVPSNGGAIGNFGIATINASSFSHNTAGNDGGAIDSTSTSRLTITNSEFSNNSVTLQGGAAGGAIGNYAAGTTISNSSFSNNSAISGGAVATSGGLTINGSTFTHNTGYIGGAIIIIAGTLAVSNTTFTSNFANNYGGAIDNTGNLTVSNSTISGNSSALSGGGYYGDCCGTGASLAIGSSIVAGNTLTGNGGTGPDFDNANGTITSLGYDLIGDGTGETGITNGVNHDQVGTSATPLDPQLLPLGNYGGSTQTMLLPVGSLAYTTGNCNLGSPAAPVTTDQRGVTRKTTPGCDIGAFEEAFNFAPGTLPSGVVGNPYSQTITASDSVSAGSNFAAVGTLPYGLSLSSGGLLSGTPTAGGTFTFVVTAQDSSGYTGGMVYTVTISGPTPTPTNTLTPTATFTASITPTASNTSTPTATGTPSNTPTNTNTPTATSTPLPPRIDSIGVFRSGTFYLRLHNSTGIADITVGFNPGSKPYPVVGDWLGQGFDTVGAFDQGNGLFSLCSANSTSACANAANVTTLVLGNPNDIPLSGTWTNGFTHFGVGVFRPSNGLIYLKNNLTSGYADDTMVLGIPGDTGLAGDWNGDGLDSPGVYRASNQRFYLTDQVCNCSVVGSYQLQYGVAGDYPVTGDWIGQGHDGVGLFRQSNGFTYLRNELTTGYADITFVYGIAGDVPVAGHWQLVYPPQSNPGSVLVPPTLASTPRQGTRGDGLRD